MTRAFQCVSPRAARLGTQLLQYHGECQYLVLDITMKSRKFPHELIAELDLPTHTSFIALKSYGFGSIIYVKDLGE